MNRVFVALILIACVTALLCDINILPSLSGIASNDGVGAPHLGALSKGVISSAETAVDVSLGLIGILALWMGVLRVAEAAGLVKILAKLLSPIMKRLFKDVPEDHPAMGAMVMNISANMLGLGNAATPLGLEAMRRLQELNEQKDTASNAMILFLAINTSGLTLIPIRVIGIRAKQGSIDPMGIAVPTLLATLCSTFVAVAVAKLLARTFPTRAGTDETTVANAGAGEV